MPIIVSKNGKKAIRVDRRSFERERHLQQYIYDNPEVIPVEEIEEEAQFLVLDREFPVRTGPIDIIGVDNLGNLYVVETKLYKNPDKRAVVAQILDYGAALSEMDPDEIVKRLDKRIGEREGLSLESKIATTFTESDILDVMRANLRESSIRFIVLMDVLQATLKDLIRFLNKSSTFSIYVVELEYYSVHDFEILIPHIFGEETEKNVRSKVPRELTQTQKDYVQFFQKVVDDFRQKVAVEIPPPRGSSYHQIRIGLSGVHFEWGFHGRPRDSFCVELHFERKDKESNRRMLSEILKSKREIEEKVGQEMIVDEDFFSNWTRVYFERKGGNMSDELQRWAIDTMLKFYEVALQKVKRV